MTASHLKSPSSAGSFVCHLSATLAEATSRPVQLVQKPTPSGLTITLKVCLSFSAAIMACAAALNLLPPLPVSTPFPFIVLFSTV